MPKTYLDDRVVNYQTGETAVFYIDDEVLGIEYVRGKEIIYLEEFPNRSMHYVRSQAEDWGRGFRKLPFYAGGIVVEDDGVTKKN